MGKEVKLDLALGWGKQNGIDDMDHAVSGMYISGYYLGLVEENRAVLGLHLELLAINSLCLLQGHGGLGIKTTRHDMVGENGNQLVFVLRLKEIFHCTLGKLCKSLISWSKHGERAFPFEGVDQVTGL